MSAAHEFDTLPRGSSRIQRSLSVVQKAGLALIIMIVLVGAASGTSLWFAAQVQQSVKSMRLATEQAIRVSDLQLRWLEIAGILDTLSVTRSTPGVQAALDEQLSELERQLAALASEPLGLSVEKIGENKLLSDQLRQTGLEMTGLVRELYALIEQGRWGTALQRRQSGMSALQTELSDNLSQLNNNIQSDVSAQVNEIARLQSLARAFSLAAVAAAVLFAALAVWMTRRTIVLPIQRLIGDVKMISNATSAAELVQIEPLKQQDELGELSQAMGLMAGWLHDSYANLEQQVAERTSQLQRRSLQLEVAAQVARDIAATHDLEILLFQAVNTIRDRFDFYHSGIFLVDQQREFAVLRAATGEAGQEMLARNHRLKIGETGLVGHTAQAGESRISSDVQLDREHFKNPLLPDTRSEAALPLKTGGQVIGVLDVQSHQPGAFDKESVETLQIMADQLAIAIQNAQLIQQSQENLQELESTYGRINRQAWELFIRSNQVAGYEFDGLNTHPIMRIDQSQQGLVPEMQLDDFSRLEEPTRPAPLQIPLRVRGQVIGALDVWPEGDEFSESEVALLEIVGSRLSQILESARLYEEAQRMAWREQQINTITSQARTSVNLETILKTTVQELGKSLGVSRAFIQVGGQFGLPENNASPFVKLLDIDESLIRKDRSIRGSNDGSLGKDTTTFEEDVQ